MSRISGGLVIEPDLCDKWLTNIQICGLVISHVVPLDVVDGKHSQVFVFHWHLKF